MSQKRDVTGWGASIFLGMRDAGVTGGEGGGSIFPDISVT